jgi:hypothetical protein
VVNLFEGQTITAMEISVHHNIVFVSSGSVVAVYDYEMGRLISEITLNDNEEVTSIAIVNGYSLVYISTNFGMIYVLKFLVKDQTVVHYDIIAILRLKDQ